MKPDDLTELIGSFYDGALAQDGWVDSLHKLVALTSSDAASIVLWNRYSNTGMVSEQVGLPGQLQIDYRDHFHLKDPGRDFVDTVAVGHWYMDERDFGAASMRGSAFYQDFLRPYALGSTMATPIIRASGTDGFLSLSSRPGRRDMAKVAEGLSALLPHIERAAHLRMRLLTVTQQLELHTHALDSLSFPVLVVTYDKKVMLANRLGQQWLSSAANPLGTASPHAEEVGAMLKTASGLNGVRRAASMMVRKPDGAVVVVTAVPLPTAAASSWHQALPMSLLWINDPAQVTAPLGELLRHLFGLSPAEIRLVAPLLQGATLKEAVFELGLSLETGRSHLKSVFTKLGIRRQSEMQRLLGRFNLVESKS